MARTKRQSKTVKPASESANGSSASHGIAAAAASSSSSSSKIYTPAELLDRAQRILDSDDGEDLELAIKFAQRARDIQGISKEELDRCSEILGTCYLDLGDEKQAKELFMQCRESSWSALLYLAQLADTPEEALLHNKAAVDILSTKVDLTGGPAAQGKDRAWSSQERLIRVQISRALVAMTELYLTELCMEEDAEARCTEYLDMALRVDAGADINPEIYITLASVRLSQCRPEDALASLRKSHGIWRDEPPNSLNIPPFAARLNLGRLFVECEAYDEGIEVLEGLEDENDEDYEVLYLLGLANWLIGEKALKQEEKREAYIDSREVLDRFLQTYERKPHDCDEEMLAQVRELVTALEKEKKITMKVVEKNAAKVAAELAAKEKAETGTGPGEGVDEEDGWEDEEDEQGDAVMQS